MKKISFLLQNTLSAMPPTSDGHIAVVSPFSRVILINEVEKSWHDIDLTQAHRRVIKYAWSLPDLF